MNLFSFIERRKQIQVSALFNFLSSSLSYFDFSSFELIENLEEYNILEKNNKGYSFKDLLFLMAFVTQKDNYFISKSLKKFLIKYNKTNLKKNLQISLFEKLFFKKSHKISKKKISHDLKHYYEQAINSAYLKYKTPIVTSEIFILTSIAENPVIFKDLLKFFIKNKKQWFILKYKLVRHIYFQNYTLNLYVRKNLWNYTYLLDKYSYIKKSNPFFKKSIEAKLGEKFQGIKRIFGLRKNLQTFNKETESILNLRALILAAILKCNFQKLLEDDILLNKKSLAFREYKTKSHQSKKYKK